MQNRISITDVAPVAQTGAGAQMAALAGSLENVDPLKLLRTLWNGKIWILLFGLLGFSWGIYSAFVKAVPVYTAAATVALQSRTEQVVDVGNVVGGLGSDLATVNTEVEVIRSRGLSEKVVKELKLIEDPEFNGFLRPPETTLRSLILELIQGAPPEAEPPTEEIQIRMATGALQGRISVNNLRQSYVFQISAMTGDPTKSAMIANAMAEMYISDQLEVKFEATRKATEWLAQRVSELEVNLEDALDAMKSFSASSELISPEALELINRQLKDQRKRLSSLELDLVASREHIDAMRAIRTTGDIEEMARVANDPILNRIIRNRQNIDNPEVALSAFDSAIERQQEDAERLTQQIAVLAPSILEIEEKIERQSADLVQLQQLEREAEASRLIYESFLSRLKETSVQQGIQKADSRVLSYATPPTGPSAPRKSRIAMLWLVLGLMAGGGIVLLRELSQSTFRTAEDLEAATMLSVIGQVPMIPARKRKGVIDYLIENPTSMAAEAIRNLRTSILMANLDKPCKVIMSTSSVPGESKTTTSIALAQNLTGLGKRVLLVECDMRRRVFAEYFAFQDPKGLLSVLSGETPPDEAIQRAERLGVDVLVGEHGSVNAADVFSSDVFADLIQALREAYDYIVLDTPPALLVPDARIIGQHADAIIVNVKWNSTPRRIALDCVKNLESVGLRISGLVLSQVNMRQAAKYSHYGSYRTYGKGYYHNS